MAWSIIAEIRKHKGLMSAADVKRITGYSRTQVYELMESGDIPTVPFARLKNRTAKRESRKVDPSAWERILCKRDPNLIPLDSER